MPNAPASQTTLEIPLLAAELSAHGTPTAQLTERAVKTDVRTPAPTMPAESHQSATSGTTESPAPALNTSREIPTADAMLSAQSTATAIKTRRAPNYSA